MEGELKPQPVSDDYNDYIDDSSVSDTRTFTPSQQDPNTFRQRNDPKDLLYRFKLQLLNAYEAEEEVTDENTGKVKRVVKVKKRKDGKGKPLPARVNKQGVEDIISYMEKLVNSHTVQGNIDDMNEFRTKMRHISHDVTIHFIAKRRDWGASLTDIDMLMASAVNLIDIFLSRTLFNKEREGYGEGFTEKTVREIKPTEKPNALQLFAGKLAKGWK